METKENGLSLNKDLYESTGRHFIGILSPKSKHLLTLPLEERSGGAFINLTTELEDIKFFKRFSNKTKNLLAKKLYFVSRPAEDVLLRQGNDQDPPQAMFVILNGVITTQYKPSNSDKPWPEKIMRKGDFFGHVDIMRDRTPSADAKTLGYSELLMLQKDDFHIVQDEMTAYSSQLEHHLRTTEAIARFEWTDKEYKVLEIYAKLSTYAENLEVYCESDSSHKPPWSYFVVSGECRIARELVYSTLDMKVVHGSSEESNSKLTRKVLDTEIAKQGYFFAVGEDFGRNKVIACSTLDCLLIPRLLLVFKNKRLLQEMADDLAASLPSDQEVLDSHAKLVSRCKKEADMFKELFKDQPHRLVSN